METGTPSPPKISGNNLEVTKGGPDVRIDQAQVIDLANTYADAVYSDLDPALVESWKPGVVDRLNELIADPNSVLIYEGDKLVALGGWKHHGNTESGQDVIELTMAIVHPEYQGRGISRQLYEGRDASIREQFSGGLVAIISKSPAVHHSATKRGFAQVPLGDYFSMTADDPRLSEAAKMEEMGFQAFTLDLAEVGDQRGDTGLDLYAAVPEF